MRKATRKPPGRGGAAAIGAGSSMWRERSQDSFVSIHFWRGVLGNGCPDSTHHDPLASPNPLVLRKRRRRATAAACRSTEAEPAEHGEQDVDAGHGGDRNDRKSSGPAGDRAVCRRT